jgi:hypothetical protein
VKMNMAVCPQLSHRMTLACPVRQDDKLFRA